MTSVSMVGRLTCGNFIGFLVMLYPLQLWPWFSGTWLAVFYCVGSDIVVPILVWCSCKISVAFLLTRTCYISLLLPRALLVWFLVWGCALGLVISGFIRLALFFLFRCFCSSRCDCCACLYLAGLPLFSCPVCYCVVMLYDSFINLSFLFCFPMFSLVVWWLSCFIFCLLY